MTSIYNDPAGGSESTVGSQIRTDYWHKKALVEAAKESYFGQLSSTRAMPKHMGKKIKQYHYLPILDDRNLNDQGIDAAGAVTTATTKKVAYIQVAQPDAQATAGAGEIVYFRGDSTVDAAGALTNVRENARAWLVSKLGIVDGDGASTDTTYAELNSAGSGTSTAGLAFDLGYIITEIPATDETVYGNLYGSSKDVGTIKGKIPALTENGGAVNRVSMKRIELESTLDKRGFYMDYTKESIDFDTDDELEMHYRTEMLKAATEIQEDELQIDILEAAGTLRYTGNATSTATLTGGGTPDVITYDDLVKLSIELDNTRTPKHTKVISGSRMTDTKVVNSARYVYIGSELLPSIMKVQDYFNNKAYIPVAQYASAGNIARGEVGAIDNFRFIVVPEMAHWAGAGAAVTTGEDEAYRFGADATGNSRYNVYPMLVVGDSSFVTVGFQTDGKSVKFKIKHVKPESDGSYSREHDPYGEKGFFSIKWYKGFMALRPEWIALVKTVAEW